MDGFHLTALGAKHPLLLVNTYPFLFARHILCDHGRHHVSKSIVGNNVGIVRWVKPSTAYQALLQLDMADCPGRRRQEGQDDQLASNSAGSRHGYPSPKSHGAMLADYWFRSVSYSPTRSRATCIIIYAAYLETTLYFPCYSHTLSAECTPWMTARLHGRSAVYCLLPAVFCPLYECVPSGAPPACRPLRSTALGAFLPPSLIVLFRFRLSMSAGLRACSGNGATRPGFVPSRWPTYAGAAMISCSGIACESCHRANACLRPL